MGYNGAWIQFGRDLAIELGTPTSGCTVAQPDTLVGCANSSAPTPGRGVGILHSYNPV